MPTPRHCTGLLRQNYSINDMNNAVRGLDVNHHYLRLAAFLVREDNVFAVKHCSDLSALDGRQFSFAVAFLDRCKDVLCFDLACYNVVRKYSSQRSLVLRLQKSLNRA